MKGALVFIIAFLIFLGATLAYPQLPPGRQLYGSLGVQEISDPVLGVPTTTLICAVFNGVIYGIIAWLIYTITQRIMKPK